MVLDLETVPTAALQLGERRTTVTALGADRATATALRPGDGRLDSWASN